MSKAQILKDLESRVEIFKIPELLSLSADKIGQITAEELTSISLRFFGSTQLIVRSSATDEDSNNSSNAGAFRSVLGVRSDDAEALYAATQSVLDSFKQKRRVVSNDEVIYQRLIEHPVMSGVIFTHCLNTGAPYYVINYDDVSGLTNTVTSGDGEYANRTLYIHRGATQAVRSERFRRLIIAVQELEQLLSSEFLDIEFALDEGLQPYLLQVREITTRPNWSRAVARRIDISLQGIQSFVRERLRPAYGVYGRTTVLGQMPDWNPVEMIGRAPRALAFSLYRTLITDHAWRHARESMGYASPPGQALMTSLSGQPFIDTRLSFHSYLPADLPASIAHKLVDTWVARLREHPQLHDKIEFEVAITAFSFDVDEKLARLVGDVLSVDERQSYRDALFRLTLPLLRGEGDGSIESAMAKVERLAGQKQPPADSGLSALLPSIADCIRLGTEPFAVLARHAFIARTLLLSLRARGVFSGNDLERFHAGVRTVASDLIDDMHRLQAGSLSSEVFMQQYGHLRPGTYDILSPRYDQMDNFGSSGVTEPRVSAHHSAPFVPDTRQCTAIDALLRDEGIKEMNSESLLRYCTAAITSREYSKFVFSRWVSAILELVADFGERHGLSREEMSHVAVGELLDVALCSNDASLEESLRIVAKREAERHSITSAIRLPQILFDEAGVHVVPFQVSQPNFITRRKITGLGIVLTEHYGECSLNGKVVMIENADPGFDYLFNEDIAGLVTKFGGANSHMAIRCSEFGIPAAIGCGEQIFEKLLDATYISIDCSSSIIYGSDH